MKTYNINNVEINEEELRKIIKDNPELVKEENKSRYFTPNVGEDFFSFDNTGEIQEFANNDCTIDSELIVMGVYRTKEETQLARDKQLALVRMWNYADEKFYFRPDWSNQLQDKYHVIYHHLDRKFTWYCSGTIQHNFLLPYFKSCKDIQEFIKDNQKDLELFLK